MLQQRPHYNGLITEPILVAVLKFYWLDIVNLRRMCNRFSTNATFFGAIFSAVASHVHGWLHDFYRALAKRQFLKKIASPVKTKNRTCSRGLILKMVCFVSETQRPLAGAFDTEKK